MVTSFPACRPSNNLPLRGMFADGQTERERHMRGVDQVSKALHCVGASRRWNR